MPPKLTAQRADDLTRAFKKHQPGVLRRPGFLAFGGRARLAEPSRPPGGIQAPGLDSGAFGDVPGIMAARPGNRIASILNLLETLSCAQWPEPHIIDLDQWYKGDWRRVWGGSNLPAPALKFTLEPNALIKQRDWIEGQLDLLSTDLCDLASAHGFK